MTMHRITRAVRGLDVEYDELVPTGCCLAAAQVRAARDRFTERHRRGAISLLVVTGGSHALGDIA